MPMILHKLSKYDMQTVLNKTIQMFAGGEAVAESIIVGASKMQKALKRYGSIDSVYF